MTRRARVPCLLAGLLAWGAGARAQDSAILAPEPAQAWSAAAPQAEGASPKPASDAERRALEYFNAGKRKLAQDPAGALWEVERAIRLLPDHPRPWSLKAAALNGLRRFEDAESAALKSIRLKAENPDAYESLAWAQLNLGRDQEAVLAASKAVEQKPRSAQAYAIRAFAYESAGQSALKMADIEQAATLDSRSFGRHLTAARGGGQLFSAARPESADRREAPFWSTGQGLGAAAAGAALLLASCLGGLFAVYWSRRDAGAAAAVAASAARPAADAAAQDGGLLAAKYELTRVIGRGGMGQVWEARDRTLNRTVAVKKMSEEMGSLGARARQYYVQEARTVASLHHPHIIAIYEILDLPSGIFLVFEMAAGKTVQHLLAERRQLGARLVRDILRPVCDALDFAHGRGFVHRDLKPSNIMLTEQGFVKVMDFGIARRIEEKVSPPSLELAALPNLRGIPVAHTRHVTGTPAYMAPEAERGVVTSVSDVYSLGVCCYEMFTGALPFGPHGGPAKLERSFAKASARAPGLAAEADALLYDALDPNPETRIPSAREFQSRLERLAERAAEG